MAGLSYPFDSGPGSAITEDQWSFMMRDAVGNGVHETSPTNPGPMSTDLQAFSLAEVGKVYVYAGRATINGFHYQQGGTETLSVTPNTSGTLDRIDAVVLRLDLNTNAITLEVKAGVPAGTPVPPALTSLELLLATFRVRKNSSTVLANEVTDRRVFIGRRVRPSNSLTGPKGDIVYVPTSGRWVGLDGLGSGDAFAFSSELQAHKSDVDPHPQYLTQAEGNAAYNATRTNAGAGDFEINPAFTVFNKDLNMINLPGGIKIIQASVYMKFGGVEQDAPLWLGTLSPAFYPSVTQRYVGQQWIFTNSGDSFPFLYRIRNDGWIETTDTRIMNSAFVVFNCTYFKGV